MLKEPKKVSCQIENINKETKNYKKEPNKSWGKSTITKVKTTRMVQ